MNCSSSLHPQRFKELCHHAVALSAVECEGRQGDVHIVPQVCSHGSQLIPVRSSAPVGLHSKRNILVGASVDTYRLFVGPLCHSAILAHEVEGQFDIGTRCDIPFQVQCQPIGKAGSNHQQCRDILRADARLNLQRTTLQLLATDAEGRISLPIHIGNVGPQLTQCLHQCPYGALLHTLATRDYGLPLSDGKVSCEESHGGSRGTDINELRTSSLCLHTLQHVVGVVTHGKVVNGIPLHRTQCLQQQRTVAHTFRCGQCDACYQLFGYIK